MYVDQMYTIFFMLYSVCSIFLLEHFEFLNYLPIWVSVSDDSDVVTLADAPCYVD